MKRISSIIVMMLCAITMNVKAINTDGPKAKKDASCDCCKNCKDDKCKELCTKYSSMTPEAQKSADGQKVKAECMKICEEKKCCTSADGKSCCMDSKSCSKSCDSKDAKKDCCKKGK